MSKYYYTSDEIIKSVKRRIIMPTSQNTFTDQDLLDFATEEINMGLVPLILAEQEDYFLYDEYIQLVPGTSKYTIPYRATGNKIREVSHRRNDNNTDLSEMTRIGVGDLPFYNQNQTNSNVHAFYISNNQICLVPDNPTNNYNGQLKVSYYIRPNTLVPLAEVGIVTAINTTTGVVSLTTIPPKFLTPSGTLRSDLLNDFIMIKSPHKTLLFDIKPLSIDTVANTMTFTTMDIPKSLVIGDHISEATESAVPQVPSDLHVMLAHRVAARCLEALGDTEGLQNANVKLAEMEKNAKDLINNRVEDAPRKLTNRHAIIRGGLSSRRFRG